jgi:hypothetical protein
MEAGRPTICYLQAGEPEKQVVSFTEPEDLRTRGDDGIRPEV